MTYTILIIVCILGDCHLLTTPEWLRNLTFHECIDLRQQLLAPITSSGVRIECVLET